MSVYGKGKGPEIVFQGGQPGWTPTSAQSYELEKHLESIIPFLADGPIKEKNLYFLEDLKARK